MRHLLYIIGIPGSGKSTALAAALQGLPVVGQGSQPFAMVHYKYGVQLGRVRKAFSGTDALSLSVQPRAEDWITAAPPYVQAVVAEGDRLANVGFFRSATQAGWALDVIYLDVPLQIARQRCLERGSNQNEVWWKGRCTKVANLCAQRLVYRIDGTLSVAAVAAGLQSRPALQALFDA